MSRTVPLSSSEQEPTIIVLIPTFQRPKELRRAIEGIQNQTRTPNYAVIVHESQQDLDGVEDLDGTCPTVITLNQRTSNLPGAINQGIEEILTRRFDWNIDPETTYLALLDDDDWWKECYLEHCLALVNCSDADIVVAGITRYDEQTPHGQDLPIPHSLNMDDFLVGNPNVQGSNLFVKLSCFLRAGGFDEHLASTTDRDFCLRLLESGDVKFAMVDKHLVHHNALGKGRISDRGGKRKETGLRAFTEKHLVRMTPQQIGKFKKRCIRLFSIDPFSGTPQKENMEQTILGIDEEQDEGYVLTIAATIMNQARAKAFLEEVDAFMQGFDRPWRLVTVLYQCSKEEFDVLLEKHPTLRDKIIIHQTEDFNRMADHGLLGPWLIEPKNRIGIALGRTILHRAVLDASLNDTKPVAWILDDDMRLTGLKIGIPSISAEWMDLDRYIRSLFSKKVAIGIGTILGDPAIPTINSLRVQLLDLNQSLLAIMAKERTKPTVSPQNRPEWYYDLSTKHTDHLEWPLAHALGSNPIARAVKILQELHRGMVSLRHSDVSATSHPWYDGDTMATRGGNTIVLDTECLRLYPNISPVIQGKALRRSDTLWTILNQRLGGRIMGHEKKIVCYIPLHLPHDKSVNGVIEDPVNHLREDVLGSGITRALDNHFKLFTKFDQFSNSMTVDGATAIVNDTMRFSQQRNARLIQNLYRIEGLIDALTNTAVKLGNQFDEDSSILLTEVFRLKEWFKPSISKVWEMKFDDADVRELLQFIIQLPSNIDKFRIRQPYTAGLIRHLQEVGVNTKTTILDPVLYSMMNDGGTSAILDYGCGMGEVVQALVEQGHKVIGYDIDRELITGLKFLGKKANYISPEQLEKLRKKEVRFQKILCSLVLCTIEDDAEVNRVLKDIKNFSMDESEIIIAICNPKFISVKETESHIKLNISPSGANKFVYQKKLKSLGTIRSDVYRPLSTYQSMFRDNGLSIQGTYETPATNLEDGTPASDFMIIRLRPFTKQGGVAND